MLESLSVRYRYNLDAKDLGRLTQPGIAAPGVFLLDPFLNVPAFALKVHPIHQARCLVAPLKQRAYKVAGAPIAIRRRSWNAIVRMTQGAASTLTHRAFPPFSSAGSGLPSNGRFAT